MSTKYNIIYCFLQLRTVSPYQKLKWVPLIHLLACFLASILCLLVTCLTIFWDSNVYTSSRSEYFTEKVEEKKEIQKQGEAAATPSLPSRTASATVLPGGKKSAKQGFGSLDLNISYNTNIDKGDITFFYVFYGPRIL